MNGNAYWTDRSAIIFVYWHCLSVTLQVNACSDVMEWFLVSLRLVLFIYYF